MPLGEVSKLSGTGKESLVGDGPCELPSSWLDGKASPARPHELYGDWPAQSRRARELQSHYHVYDDDNETKRQYAHRNIHTHQSSHRQNQVVSPLPPSLNSISNASLSTATTAVLPPTILPSKFRRPSNDPLRSNPASPIPDSSAIAAQSRRAHQGDEAARPGLFWCPPPNYGSQPAELDPQPSRDGRSRGSASPGTRVDGEKRSSGRSRRYWLRRTGSGKRGTSWAPAELEGTAAPASSGRGLFM